MGDHDHDDPCTCGGFERGRQSVFNNHVVVEGYNSLESLVMDIAERVESEQESQSANADPLGTPDQSSGQAANYAVVGGGSARSSSRASGDMSGWENRAGKLMENDKS